MVPIPIPLYLFLYASAVLSGIDVMGLQKQKFITKIVMAQYKMYRVLV